METNKYDVVVIGFGKAGKTLANDLAKAGKKVAVIEKSNQMYGGTCINVGCLPTKSLVHSAKIASHILESESEQSYEKKTSCSKKRWRTKKNSQRCYAKRTMRSLPTLRLKNHFRWTGELRGWEHGKDHIAE